MSENAFQMTADEALTKRINAANSPEELRAILEDAMARGHIANRDPETGRFIPVAPTEPQQQTTGAAVTEKQPVVTTKTVTIGGQEMEFSGTELEVANQIAAAHQAADAVKQQFTNRKSAEHIALEKAEWERKLRIGQATAAEYLENTGAIDEYLKRRGLDIQQIANERYTQSWADASAAFLKDPANDWPGGPENMRLIGMKIQSLGLEETDDKVAALKQAYSALKEEGLLFSNAPSQREMEEMTAEMTPQQIMSEWKNASGIEGDAEAANAAFIEAFKDGRRSSGLFGS
jgi:hypothetical protein